MLRTALLTALLTAALLVPAAGAAPNPSRAAKGYCPMAATTTCALLPVRSTQPTPLRKPALRIPTAASGDDWSCEAALRITDRGSTHHAC
jgi:hypothetical protein